MLQRRLLQGKGSEGAALRRSDYFQRRSPVSDVLNSENAAGILAVPSNPIQSLVQAHWQMQQVSHLAALGETESMMFNHSRSYVNLTPPVSNHSPMAFHLSARDLLSNLEREKEELEVPPAEQSKLKAKRNWGKVAKMIREQIVADQHVLDQLELIPPIRGLTNLGRPAPVIYTPRERIRFFLGLEDEDGRRYETMHPNSRFSTIWHVLQGLFLIYIALVLPFRIGFESELDCDSSLGIFDLFVDLFFIVDVGLQFFVGFKKLGSVVTDREAVKVDYLRGSFVFDALISIPVTWIQYFWFGAVLCPDEDPNTNAFKAARLLRLMRLLRVVRSVKLFSNTIFERLPISSLLMQLLKMGLLSLFCGHVTACAFWYCKTLTVDLTQFYYENNLVNSDLGDKYVVSLYFAATMLTTVGFGDIHGTSTPERIYCIFSMIVGASVFATVISNISSIVANQDSKEQILAQRLRELNEFIELHEVPKSIADRLRSFYNQNFQIDETSASMDWIQDLPVVLKSGLCEHLSRGILGSIPLFKDAPSEFVTAVFLSLRLFRVAAGEVILQSGHRGTKMYIIFKGLVKVKYPCNAGFALLRPPEIFGENVIMAGEPLFETRQTTCFAVEDVDLYYLERSDLLQALSLFPHLHIKFKQFAIQRRLEVQSKIEANATKITFGKKRTARSIIPLILQYMKPQQPAAAEKENTNEVELVVADSNGSGQTSGRDEPNDVFSPLQSTLGESEGTQNHFIGVIPTIKESEEEAGVPPTGENRNFFPPPNSVGFQDPDEQWNGVQDALFHPPLTPVSRSNDDRYELEYMSDLCARTTASLQRIDIRQLERIVEDYNDVTSAVSEMRDYIAFLRSRDGGQIRNAAQFEGTWNQSEQGFYPIAPAVAHTQY